VTPGLVSLDGVTAPPGAMSPFEPPEHLVRTFAKEIGLHAPGEAPAVAAQAAATQTVRVCRSSGSYAMRASASVRRTRSPRTAAGASPRCPASSGCIGRHRLRSQARRAGMRSRLARRARALPRHAAGPVPVHPRVASWAVGGRRCMFAAPRPARESTPYAARRPARQSAPCARGRPERGCAPSTASAWRDVAQFSDDPDPTRTGPAAARLVNRHAGPALATAAPSRPAPASGG
jgi:hypothetical protein